MATSSTSASGKAGRSWRADAAPTTRPLAEQQAGQVVEVGRLLDDLSTALRDVAPPGRSRRGARPARHEEVRRPFGERGPELGQEVEAAPLVADRGHEARAGQRGGDALGVGGHGPQRLLGEERDPPPDELLAGRRGPIGRQAHEDDLRRLLVEHPLEVRVARSRPTRR